MMMFRIHVLRNYPDEEVYDDSGGPVSLDRVLEAIKQELENKRECTSFMFTIVPVK